MTGSNNPDMIFHYCDARAAQSIIMEGKVWLSSFSLSNDSREGIVGREAIIAAAHANNAYPQATSVVNYKLELLDSIYGCYGMCFSADDDRLSQWRGYADDGAGFAIGFRADMSGWLQMADQQLAVQEDRLRLHKVLYSQEEHGETASRIYQAMEPHVGHLGPPRLALNERPLNGPIGFDKEIRKAHEALNDTLLESWPELYTMKSEAFEEESEWRALTVALHFQNGFKFRISKGKLVPYIEHRLPESPDENPIRSIVLGPRNNTPKYVVEMMLASRGLSRLVNVYPSRASYRS